MAYVHERIWDPLHGELMYEIEKCGLDSKGNYKVINYLNTGDCANIMEADQISIHVGIGDPETGETGESILDFLENQMDKTKKLILIVLTFKGSVAEFVDKFLISIDTKER